MQCLWEKRREFQVPGHSQTTGLLHGWPCLDTCEGFCQNACGCVQGTFIHQCVSLNPPFSFLPFPSLHPSSFPHARHVQYCPDEEPAHDPHRWVISQYVTTHPCHLGGSLWGEWGSLCVSVFMCLDTDLEFEISSVKVNIND